MYFTLFNGLEMIALYIYKKLLYYTDDLGQCTRSTITQKPWHHFFHTLKLNFQVIFYITIFLSIFIHVYLCISFKVFFSYSKEFVSKTLYIQKQKSPKCSILIFHKYKRKTLVLVFYHRNVNEYKEFISKTL